LAEGSLWSRLTLVLSGFFAAFELFGAAEAASRGPGAKNGVGLSVWLRCRFSMLILNSRESSRKYGQKSLLACYGGAVVVLGPLRSWRFGKTAGALFPALVVVVLIAGFFWNTTFYESSFLKYVLFVLLTLPVVVPSVDLLLQRASMSVRRFVARLIVRRALAVFRRSLGDARKHPEFVNTDRLREAAAKLVRYAGDADLSQSTELAEAARHPYGPIRSAANSVFCAATRTVGTKTPSSGPHVG
jgi:hypothetical protein